MSAQPSGTYRMWDVSVCDPCARSYVGFAARHDLGTARGRDAAKRTKYDRADDPASCTALGHTFIPLSLETTGAFGPAFSGWFAGWIQEQREAEMEAGGEGWQTARLSTHWQQQISCALHRSIAIVGLRTRWLFSLMMALEGSWVWPSWLCPGVEPFLFFSSVLIE